MVILIVYALTDGTAQIPVKAYYAAPGSASDFVGRQDYTSIGVTLPIYAVAWMLGALPPWLTDPLMVRLPKKG